MENQQIIEKMAEMSKFVIDSITEMKNINENIISQLAKQQIAAVEGFNVATTRQLGELSAVKSPIELLDAQTAITTEVAKDVKDHAMRVISILTESQNEMRVFVEKNVQQFVDKALSAA
ncbi:MAG: phasin family protein [Magnetococcales bacterium]|nr:phasin family protein [Magnetococcales bacterium]MBF0260357.1 phasin family protein [Magnetococcales bacterium]